MYHFAPIHFPEAYKIKSEEHRLQAGLTNQWSGSLLCVCANKCCCARAVSRGETKTITRGVCFDLLTVYDFDT